MKKSFLRWAVYFLLCSPFFFFLTAASDMQGGGCSNVSSSPAPTPPGSSFTVTPSGEKVSLDPSDPQTVGEGETASFSVTADEGYMLSEAVGGTCPSGSWSGNTYTTGAISQDCSLSFSATNGSTTAFTVTPSGENLTIAPSAAQSVEANATASFTVTGDSGYIVSQTVGGTCPAGSWSGDVYTTGAITEDCALSFSGLLTTLLASGYYFNGVHTIPLVEVSHDLGATWAYPSSIMDTSSISDFTQVGALWGANCYGATCIVAGSYYSSGGPQKPLVALSSDSGATWSYPSDITNVAGLNPTFDSSGILHGASCSGALCIAAGAYSHQIPSFPFPISRSYPLLAVSTDSGSTWSYPTSITNPSTTPAFVSGGFATLPNASCSGSICIAVGNYSDGSVSRPLLALTTDAGSSWSFPSAITNPTITPAFTSNGILYGGSCDGAICVAAGFYNSGSETHPLLALSSDSGSSWSFPTSIAMPTTTPTYGDYGSLLSAKCSGTLCIAAGGYRAADSSFYPLVAVSQDSGSTWSFPTSITNAALTPPSSGLSTVFNGASCYASTCIAAGSYYAVSSVNYPLLAVSQDSGSTWAYVNSVPADFDGNGYLYGASCIGSTCIASGYYNDTLSVERPLLMLSTDSGSTWSFPSDINNNLPVDFSFGLFYGAGGGY